ncbi:MAG TPA: hypothetical protein PKD55_18775 [Bellilinea sp.]|nr:hypothetical protein [Bellilinea sp.]
MGKKWITIPIEAVSSRSFIEWQCDGAKGMTLNRLGEVCGCFSNASETYGCHHPDNGDEQCLAHACPLAHIDYPEGATEEECDRYAEGYGDEVCMELSEEGKFGHGGEVKRLWWREDRLADEYVESKLHNREIYTSKGVYLGGLKVYNTECCFITVCLLLVRS